MILTIYNTNKQIIEIKFFIIETAARIYFSEYYGRFADDFGNLQYYYTLE